jgi:hypothetical protein
VSADSIVSVSRQAIPFTLLRTSPMAKTKAKTKAKPKAAGKPKATKGKAC